MVTNVERPAREEWNHSNIADWPNTTPWAEEARHPVKPVRFESEEEHEKRVAYNRYALNEAIRRGFRTYSVYDEYLNAHEFLTADAPEPRLLESRVHAESVKRREDVLPGRQEPY